MCMICIEKIIKNQKEEANKEAAARAAGLFSLLSYRLKRWLSVRSKLGG